MHSWLYLYRQEGLKPPKIVQDDTDTYRSDSDKIGTFLKECYVKSGKNTPAKEAYEVYAQWCDDCGYGCENKSNFFSELKTKGIFASSGTVSGKPSEMC